MSKIELAYPKILGSQYAPMKRCIAFEKYDGSNLHWVWEKELGWYAFGTRRSRFDLDDVGIKEFNASHPGLEEAPTIFLESWAENLSRLFCQRDYYDSAEITVFTEYLGENSFAGMHKNNDTKKLVLFDVELASGFMPPDQFVKDFEVFDIARVVYKGKLTGMFVEEVRRGKYNVTEGVVCKGGSGKDLWMVKIKTQTYMDKLKQSFKNNWEDYWE